MIKGWYCTVRILRITTKVFFFSRRKKSIYPESQPAWLPCIPFRECCEGETPESLENPACTDNTLVIVRFCSTEIRLLNCGAPGGHAASLRSQLRLLLGLAQPHHCLQFTVSLFTIHFPFRQRVFRAFHFPFRHRVFRAGEFTFPFRHRVIRHRVFRALE